MCSQSIKDEILSLKSRGTSIDLVEANGQSYALVPRVSAPSPPWELCQLDIMIAIPVADGAALDAFYLRLPYKFNGGQHRRVSGAVVDFGGSRWQLVSWHYPEGRLWQLGRDTLETHISHCRGFFMHRGAINAIN